MPAPDSANPFLEILNATSKVDPGALVTMWANLPPHPPGFTGDLFERFDDIDRNGDGFISRAEVDLACSDYVFKGQYAAALATLRKVLHEMEELSDDEIGWEDDGVTRADLGGFDFIAQTNPDDTFVARVNRYYANAKGKIQHASRTAFRDDRNPAVDPLKCQQGMMGDCFFLAALFAMAHQDPERVLSMIEPHPERPGSWQVRFPRSERPIAVTTPTEAELALFSHGDGLWSLIFEIAYGKQVHRDKYGALTRLEALEGGQADQAIETLTGEPAHRIRLSHVSRAELRERLEDALAHDKVVTAATPPELDEDEAKEEGSDAKHTAHGLRRSHVYSVLGFGRNIALMRNPWGNANGGIQGQETKNGVFKMDLAYFHTDLHSIAIEG